MDIRRFVRLLVILAIHAGCDPGAAAADEAARSTGTPGRVVSMNLCADELVLALADRAQIAAVTWLVKDPEVSWSARRADGIPHHHGTAAEVIGYDPDLVVAGTYTTRSAVAMLKRLQVPVVELDVPSTLEGVRLQIRTLARALGQQERGVAVVAAMDARLEALEPVPGPPYPVAAVYRPNGFTVGSGSMVDTVMRRAGLTNLAARQQIGGNGVLPLEVLITARPDLLIVNTPSDLPPSLAHEILRHPALVKTFAEPEIVAVPPQSWSCGTPNVVEAIERLRAAAGRWRDGLSP